MTDYAPAAQVARAYLFQRDNDLDVFVEDATSQNMYVRLVNRILDGRGAISKVYPLHGRANVTARCAADQAPGGRKRIYLIDGDLDLLTGSQTPTLDRLYRLAVYCTENILVSEEALLQLASEAASDEGIEALRTRLAIAARGDEAARALLPLFIVYAVALDLGVGVPTVGYAAVRLCREHADPETLCPILIRARMRSLARQIVNATSLAQYQLSRRRVKANVAAWAGATSHLISGKNYLLPLAANLLRAKVAFQDNFNSMRVRLAQHCDLSAEPGLAAAILKAMQ